MVGFEAEIYLQPGAKALLEALGQQGAIGSVPLHAQVLLLPA